MTVSPTQNTDLYGGGGSLSGGSIQAFSCHRLRKITIL